MNKFAALVLLVAGANAGGLPGHGAGLQQITTTTGILAQPLAGYGSAGLVGNAGYGNAGLVSGGYGNAGYGNAGLLSAGHGNAGYGNAGLLSAGHGNAGYGNAGLLSAGHGHAGYGNAGLLSAGHGNAGYGNAGLVSAGYGNAGLSAGYGNAGYGNAGYGRGIAVAAAPIAVAAAPIVDIQVPTPYSFGYGTNDAYGGQSNRQESGDGYGNVQGSYGYADASGVQRIVDYVADAAGFRAKIRTNEPGVGRNEAIGDPAATSWDIKPAPPGLQEAYSRPIVAAVAAPVLAVKGGHGYGGQARLGY